LIASGFPVIVEKGFEGVGFDGWMGHYQVVSGFDDAQAAFFVQDSYKGPNLKVAFPDFEEQWRAFNYSYLVIYPTERREQVLQILGLQAFDNYNYRFAEQKARAETLSLTGRGQYFAWYNLGTNLVALQDYTAAATAFDAAFANYPNIPEAERPWRNLWYQTGPYFAYYYTGRYQDVIDLATTTLDTMSEPVLEESFYWRARARLALGDQQGAVDDLRASLEAHPDFGPAVEQLALLGEEP
jgi:tetratricopeptide (TPR) repeat protein